MHSDTLPCSQVSTATPWYCPKVIVNGANVIRSVLCRMLTQSPYATPVLGYAGANRTWWAETAINVKKDTITFKVGKDVKVVIVTQLGRTTRPATYILDSVIAGLELQGNTF